MKNNIIIAIVSVIVGLAIGYVATELLNNEVSIAGSAVGTTFNTARVAQINFSPATASATSTSILNTDESDRYVGNNVFAYCGSVGTSQTALTGTGLASLTFKAATTSTANPAIVTNTNLAVNLTISTSTVDSYTASSTFGYSRWKSGSYLTFFANATNTAVCTVGVYYLPS